MKTPIKDVARRGIDGTLGALGLQRTARSAFSDYRDYIPFKETLAGAQAANLSVGDYIDAKHNQPGITRATIEQLAALGVFSRKIERVCEIGPGSGRYLDKTLEQCRPAHYEIYETAQEWREWLVQKHRLVAREADGSTLAQTPSKSIDLVQAHKVFPGQPSLVMLRYFAEMARVTRAGGAIVFDIVTEACMEAATLAQWFESQRGYQHYPCLMPRQFTIDFFQRQGFQLLGSFLAPMEPGKTECMVFGSE